MHLQISAVNMELTDSADIYTREKIGKLSKFLAPHQDESAIADVKLIYAPSNTKDTKDKCHVTVSGVGGGHSLHVETEEPDMHVAIDAASQKLEQQLRKEKEKRRDHIHHQPDANYVPPETMMETEPVDDEESR